jgi:predicted dienelactone hydrolase
MAHSPGQPRPHRVRPLLCRFLVGALALAATIASADDTLATMPPLGMGPYAVGCSDVAQDFTRLAPGEDVQTYWEGVPQGSRSRYITDLLSEPAATIRADVAVPNDRGLFGDFASQAVPYVVLVCYPTSAGNPRPDYALPTGRVVPHMQRAADLPLFADATSRFPVLLFGHGLGGSPISNDYISALEVFASWGYVIIAPFEGDARVADIRLEDLTDVVDAFLNFKSFIALQSLRPLSMEAALDRVLGDAAYAPHLDASRIGAFGASLGAESALLMTGARLTTTLGQSSQTVLTDPRITAVVGYVPYFGQPFYPAFGRDQQGLDGITVPFLGIAGTADTTAPIDTTLEGVQRLSGSRILVALEGVPHGFDVASTNDIFTWSLVFLAAHLEGDKTARARLTRMTHVAGGGDDRTLVDYTAPSPPSADERTVVEYYRGANNHYFITAEPAEAAMLDAGVVVPGWSRTGFDFKAWPAGSGLGVATCRFFGTPGIGPDSHFYTNSVSECAKVRSDPHWSFEGIAFNALPAVVADDCPPDRIPVTRLYNNGMGGQANHRYLTSRSEMQNMVDRGWIVEGPVFCGLP